VCMLLLLLLLLGEIGVGSCPNVAVRSSRHQFLHHLGTIVGVHNVRFQVGNEAEEAGIMQQAGDVGHDAMIVLLLVWAMLSRDNGILATRR